MTRNLHVLFFLYKSKSNERGTCPIFCRLTFNQKRKQFSTGHFAKEANWNSLSQRYRGTSIEAQHINTALSDIKDKLLISLDEVAKDKENFMVDDIYNRFAGTDKVYRTIIEAFNYHNQHMKELVGKDYVQATYDKFVVIQSHVEQFLKSRYNLSDLPLTEVKLNFLTELDHHLKVNCNLNQNTINKVIERVKKVIKVAVGNGWILSDPFILYKKKKYTKEVIFLSREELQTLETHKFVQERLAAVRDCFIFSCYTGLAYNEAFTLSKEHIQIEANDQLFISMTRQKTQRPILVPILPKALLILKKYGYPNNDGLLLPVISNQKMNSYLKEIGEVVGIRRNLTHHIARKTFASTVLLSNDVPIEIVSFLLGHSKTSTTETHYAKVVKENVMKHLNLLNEKLT